MLRGRKVLLGVSGSIAAYKSAHLVRLLVKAGAEVKVVLTPAARDFVTPLTLATLSGHPVLSTFVEEGAEEEGTWNNHVELGLWADLMVIAPASANTLSKMVHGTVDNLLLATYLSAKCPVFFAPAMDLDMFKHPSTQSNINALQSFGNTLIPSGVGELASGLYGEGRMAEPEEIMALMEQYLRERAPLHGKKVLVTAGPTHEPIDPVRFIGNHSTGKMGVALAQAAVQRGAEVTLVLGPTGTPHDTHGMRVVRVQTAAEMLAACTEQFPHADYTWMSAAVADFRPDQPKGTKIKKQKAEMHLGLVENPDILSTLGQSKTPHQVLIGFALETEDLEAHAREKMARKNLDGIVANLSTAESGFCHDTNRVIFLTPAGTKWESPLLTKHEIADQLWERILA